MRHLVFTDTIQSEYPMCLLMPTLSKHDIEQSYIYPHGLNAHELLALDLHQKPGSKKTPMKEMVSYINEELVPVLMDLKVEYLLVADADYFKALTKSAKVEVHLGYVLDCAFGPWKVVYVPNHRQIFYDPDKVKGKIALAMQAVLEHRAGNYQAPGAAIIKFAAYPLAAKEIEHWLERLIVEDRPLTCDIEAFSLKHPTAGIGTITFCWNEHEGISFPVDLGPEPATVRALLKSFFLRFKQKLIYHAIAYDVYVLIYQLFMDHILDTEGLLEGLEVMLKNWDCTKLITYLATNSCAGNKLGLKEQAQDFAGNYAQDEIKDITKIPLPVLLEYNLVDGLATWHVRKKHYQTMVDDLQLPIYEELFKPAMVDIIQMQLTGMPLNMKRVAVVKAILQADSDRAVAAMRGSAIIQQFEHDLEQKHVAKRNREMVKKRIKMGDEPQEFNPNSGPQLQALLFEMLGFPVISLTKEKQPSTDGDTLEALLNHTRDPGVLAFLKALIDFKAVDKILTSFIPAMEGAFEGPDGWHYLFGNFNLGGTVSGRLSSSKPNLQNLPANSKYAKLIKSCFEAPPGWLFCGLDFASLEDKISGLTSKDPAKLKVYTDGYDGHSLRAFAYFQEDMPGIRQSDGRRVFAVTQGGKTIHLLEGDEVTAPDGSIKKIEELV